MNIVAYSTYSNKMRYIFMFTFPLSAALRVIGVKSTVVGHRTVIGLILRNK